MPPQQKKWFVAPSTELGQANSSENNLPIILPGFANVKGLGVKCKIMRTHKFAEQTNPLFSIVL